MMSRDLLAWGVTLSSSYRNDQWTTGGVVAAASKGTRLCFARAVVFMRGNVVVGLYARERESV